MKRWISLIIIVLFAINLHGRQTASHAIRIVILQPNHFEINQNMTEPYTNQIEMEKNNNADFTLDWQTSSENKRITVALINNEMNGLLKMTQSKNDFDTIQLDNSHRELTDHLTDRQGKLQLQWIANANSLSKKPSGIVYTLSDSL